MTDALAPAHLEVCICTFRRPALAEALTSVLHQTAPPGLSLSVRVIDNDRTPSAEPLVRRIAAEAPVPVTYVHAPFGNISIARNAALETSPARFVAFLDDDERATDGWLRALVATLQESAAQVVLGPVCAIYRPSARAWLKRARPHDTRPVHAGGEIRTGYTCNVLIDRADAAIASLRFDPSYGRTGGEDTAYFARAFQAGARFAEAPDAVVEEDVPEARERFLWLLRRRFRMGQTHGELDRLSSPPHTAMPRFLSASAKLTYCALSAVLMAFLPARRNRAVLRGALHAGVLAEMVGLRPLSLYGPPPAAVDGKAPLGT